MSHRVQTSGPPVDAMRCGRCGARVDAERACWIDLPCAGPGSAVVHVPACPSCVVRRRRAPRSAA